MITLCTLFDHNYIDKGITMYESLERVSDDFILYVLCMSEKCYSILCDLNYKNLRPIRLEDFENEELLKAKSDRSVGEYCWTCSASLVDYIICTYNPSSCSYIDSDLYFYSDPNCILNEMKRRNASVQITGHRFNSYDAKKMSWRVGKYCVEFNTFINNKEGLSVLDTWRRQCLEYCKCDGDGVHWADQKYMDNWIEDYPCAIETENLGMGIAPWNIAQYAMISKNEFGPTKVKCKGKVYTPVFYHFQNMTYIDENTVRSNTHLYWHVDKKLVNSFYFPYAKHIASNKRMLREKYGIDVLLRHHPGEHISEKEALIIKILNKLDKTITKDFWTDIFFHRLPGWLSIKKGIIRM